jgi:hypothetical protein
VLFQSCVVLLARDGNTAQRNEVKPKAHVPPCQRRKLPPVRQLISVAGPFNALTPSADDDTASH